MKLFSLFIILLLSFAAHAHQPSESYLQLHVENKKELDGEWQIALRDLDHAIGIDADADGAITWGELKNRRAAINEYAFSRLRVRATRGRETAPCRITPHDMLVDEHLGGHYAVLRFSAMCAWIPERIALDYSLLFDVDPQHRGLLNIASSHGSQAFVLKPDSPRVIAEIGAVPARQIWSFVQEGMWHIWQGYDHILFLLTLLIPAVVIFRNGTWMPKDSLRSALVDVMKVVTAFTLAHSLTLALATYGWVRLPGRWVESAIALTVLLGALNNVYPLVREQRWLVAFAFGSIHGLAFATVLTDLGLRSWSLLSALLAFNAGVEVGQMAIVVVFVPLAYCLRQTVFYRRAFIQVGAASIGTLALYWLISRAVG